MRHLRQCSCVHQGSPAKGLIKGIPQQQPLGKKGKPLIPFVISFPWESQAVREMATAAIYVAVPCL